MMLAYFHPPPKAGENGRTDTVAAEDLERRIVEVDTLLRPVVPSEQRRKKYAAQMALSGIFTRGKHVCRLGDVSVLMDEQRTYSACASASPSSSVNLDSVPLTSIR